MFEIDGFGQRIQDLRKQKKLTQEELAERLGVTSQAVSKWETGLSYPDITIIPIIVTILETEMDFLFGKKKGEIKMDIKFPEIYDNMKFVHSFSNVACYSNKEVESTDGSGIKFTDGSTAELSNKLVVNNGKGEIKLLISDDIKELANIDYTKTSLDFEYDSVNNINVAVYSNICEIIKSADSKTRVHVAGSAEFISILNVKVYDDTLEVKFKEEDKNKYKFDDYKSNTIKIEVPCDELKTANIAVDGRGELNCSLDCNIGNISINGSGHIKANNFVKCSSAINGSGHININNSQNTNCAINGSGVITANNAGATTVGINGSGITTFDCAASLSAGINGSGKIGVEKINDGDVAATINGSGNIKINSGSCGHIEVNVSGNCDIEATGVTAKTAKIVLDTAGKVIIGRVTESSTEQIKKNGTIKILNRGEE